jgi:hypothetical protein
MYAARYTVDCLLTLDLYHVLLRVARCTSRAQLVGRLLLADACFLMLVVLCSDLQHYFFINFIGHHVVLSTIRVLLPFTRKTLPFI